MAEKIDDIGGGKEKMEEKQWNREDTLRKKENKKGWKEEEKGMWGQAKRGTRDEALSGDVMPLWYQ